MFTFRFSRKLLLFAIPLLVVCAVYDLYVNAQKCLKFCFSRKLLLFAIPLLIVCAANAATITYEGYYGANGSFVLTDWPYHYDDFARISITQFDPKLGTLNSVDLLWQGTVNSNFTVSNTSNQPIEISEYTAKLWVRLLGMNVTPPVDGAFTNTTEYLLQSDPQLFHKQSLKLAALGSTTGSVTNKSVTAESYGEVETAPFIGTGNVIFPVYTLSFFSAGGSVSNVRFDQTTYAQGHLTVTYNYTEAPPTPEPATSLLVGSILLGVGLFSRKVRLPKA